MARKFETSFGTKFFDENQIWDGTFHKTVKAKHLFQKYGAWGMAIETLEHLQEMGVENIEIDFPDENAVYRTTVTKFMNKGIYGSFGKAGEQKFLPITPSNYQFPYTR